MSDDEKVAADKSALQITYTAGDSATSVTGDLTLPTIGANGSSISWSSSNTLVVSAAGVVTRPVATTNLTLTATITKGSASATQDFTVTVILAAPPTPTNLVVSSPTGSSLTVSWDSMLGAASYQLCRVGVTLPVYDGPYTSFTDQNLASGTPYFYSVRATNQTGSSALSSTKPGTTSLVIPALTIGSPTASSLPVSWTGVNGATNYEVFRDTSSTGAFSTSAYSGAATNFTDSGLGAGTVYYYKIKATYPAGTSDLSATPASGTTSIVIPSGLAVGTATASSLAVSWTGVNGATSYQVYRDTSSTGLFSRLAYNGTATSFTDSGLAALTQYYYKVRATYPAGTSGLSATPASGTTLSLGTVVMPTFSPVAGTYTSGQTVTISTTTSGASIRYTTDGSTPSSTVRTVYSTAISVTTCQTIKAIAYKSGWTDSPLATAAYSITVLVANYSFSGNTLDSSGYVNNGTNEGGATLTTNRAATANSAYSFTGTTNGRIVIANSPSLAITNFQNTGYTISAWIYQTAPTTDYNVIVSKGKGAFSLRINYNTNDLEARHQNAAGSTGVQTTSTTKITNNTWYHVAVTWNAANGVWQMYLNGVAGSYTGNMTGLQASPTYGDGGVTIGGDDWYARWYFQGKIDDVRIYNRGLSASEITGLYNASP